MNVNEEESRCDTPMLTYERWQHKLPQAGRLRTMKSVLPVLETESLKSRGRWPCSLWRPSGKSCPRSQCGCGGCWGFLSILGSLPPSIYSIFLWQFVFPFSLAGFGVTYVSRWECSQRSATEEGRPTLPWHHPMGWGAGTMCKHSLRCFLSLSLPCLSRPRDPYLFLNWPRNPSFKLILSGIWSRQQERSLQSPPASSSRFSSVLVSSVFSTCKMDSCPQPREP